MTRSAGVGNSRRPRSCHAECTSRQTAAQVAWRGDAHQRHE